MLKYFDENSQEKLLHNNFVNEYQILETVFQRNADLKFVDIGKTVNKIQEPTYGKFLVTEHRDAEKECLL